MIYKSIISAVVALGLAFVSIGAQAEEDKVKVSGGLEVAYTQEKAEDDTKSSGVSVGAAFFALEAKLNDVATGHLSYWFEDGVANDVEEAYVSFVCSEGNATVNFGKKYLPFGVFDTNLVSDPLTLEVTETLKNTIEFGFAFSGATLTIGAFEGDAKKADEEQKLGTTVAKLGYAYESKAVNAAVALSYISDITDLGGLPEGLLDTDPTTEGFEKGIEAEVPGNGFALNVSAAGANLIVEQIASAEFDEADYTFDGEAAGFSVTAVELAYTLPVAGKEITIAAGQHTSEKALALGLPKTKTLVAVSSEVLAATTLALEVANSTAYETEVGGSGETSSATTLFLGVEF